MITRIIMPKLGETMEDGVISRWMKKEGDKIEKGEPILEVATDKANFEVESPAGGILRKILCPASEDNVPVTVTIGYIADSMEEGLPEEGESQPEKEKKEESVKESVPVDKKPAEQKAETGLIKASPAAKKFAREKGVDLAGITGTGPGGRITENDVLSAAGTGTAEGGDAEVIPLSGMRKVIAQRLSESKRRAPHYYVQVEVDMTGAVAAREKFLPEVKSKNGVKLSYNDMIVKAAADTLPDYPLLNSTFDGNNIKSFKDANIGIAVSIDQGLVVPVVKKAGEKSLGEIAKERDRLVALARENKLGPQDTEGGTFTVTNLGMFKVDVFTAIINPPQVAILAVGGIKKAPVVVNDKVEVRQVMKMSLSADHRVIDGAYAAQFMNRLKETLEKIKD